MDTRQWLKQLIGFNTISSHSNMQLIAAIDDWFKLHGIQTHIIHGGCDEKANLLATIPAKDGGMTGGLLLSGHTDVVPVVGQLWNTDPFVATEDNGKIYGRGACEMKAFIAVMLALVPEFKTLNLLKPIHFAFTYDEEVGCIGAEFLVEHMQTLGIHPEGCIVGEPTSMRPIIGEKSRQLYHCQIQGKAAHSSLANEGCNAIEYASDLIAYIRTLARHMQENGPFDHDFDYPSPTMTTNIVSGGIATNIIPGICEFIFEIRYPPQFPLENLRSQIQNHIDEQLLPDMQAKHPEAAIYLQCTSDAQGFTAMENSLITRIVRMVTGIQDRLKVSYSTEAGLFQDAHIPTIICGPGDIAQAHRPNEFVSIAQLALCENVLRNVVTLFCVQLNNHPVLI